MTCRICGARCHGDRCADCEQIAANEARHGAPSDHYDDEGGDEWTVEQQEVRA